MGYYAGDCARGDYYAGDYYAGDPFSLGGLLKGALGVVGGAGIPFVSGVANAAGSLLGGATPKPVATQQPIYPLPPTMGGGFTGIQVGGPGGGFAIGSGTSYIGNPSYPGTLGGEAVQPGVSITPSGQVVPCQLKGYHVNKSTYVRRKGGLKLVPKGSVCVKNRHRNPTNGRALRRALSRAYAFKNIAMKTLHLVQPRRRHVFGGFKKRRKSA